MDNRIGIIIQAQDAASATIKRVGDSVEQAGGQSSAAGNRFSRLNDTLGAFAGLTAAAGVGIYSFTRLIDGSIDSANRYQNALAGLSAIARHFGEDQNEATQAAKDLANDGLMSVTQAATGLKNLLASGFSLSQAITLMERFKDSAAFNRQAALNFGDAVASATEGIKNGNSILVDNAGVTKNLSIILEEAGHSAQDLMKATTDASIRQALFNGIVKETAPMVGNAKTLSEQFAGSQAKLATQIDIAKQKLGSALQPALLAVVQAITPAIEATGKWIEQNPRLATAIAIATAGVLGLAGAFGVLGLVVAAMAPAVAIIGGPVLLAIGLIGIAVAGLVAVVVVYWDEIRDTAIASWEAIVNAVRGFVEGVKTVVGDVATAIATYARDIFNGVVGVFTSIVNWLREWGPTVLAIIFWPFALALGFIIQNWSSISGFFQTVWSGIVAVFSPVVSFFAVVFGAALAGIQAIWGAVTGWFQAVWGGVVGVFQGVSGWFGGVFNSAAGAVRTAFSPILGFFSSMWGSIVSMFGTIGTSVGNAVGGAFRGAMNSVFGGAVGIINGFIDAVNGAIDIINNIPNVHIPRVGHLSTPHFALGTNFAPGGLALVGENGPELAYIPRGARVLSAPETSQALGNGLGNGSSINIENVNINDGSDWRLFMNNLAFALDLRS